MNGVISMRQRSNPDSFFMFFLLAVMVYCLAKSLFFYRGGQDMYFCGLIMLLIAAFMWNMPQRR